MIFSIGMSSPRPGGGQPKEDYLVSIENIPSPTFGRVEAILRDTRGLLWFGTSNGLQRYDGYEIRPYAVTSGKNEGQNHVSAIVQDADSSLILATYSGLWRFNLRTEEAHRFLGDQRLGDGRITSLVVDGRRRLWIGTYADGLFSYDPATGQLRGFGEGSGLGNLAIVHLCIDRNGIVWIGTRDGLKSLDAATGRVGRYRSDPDNAQSMSSDEITDIHEDQLGRLWVGTHNGLNLLDRKSGRVRRFYLTPGPANEVFAMAGDPSGRLWVSATGIGLHEGVDGSFARFTLPGTGGERISDRYIRALYVDPTTTRESLLLWVGTRDGGVYKLRIARNPFTNYSRDGEWPILGNGAVLSLCEDRQKILWVGLWGGGLNGLRLRDGRYTRVAWYTHNPRDPFSLPDNTINTLCDDRTGTLWVGTLDGLASLRANQHRFHIFTHRAADTTSLPSNAINKVIEDRTGRLWICTNGGLSLLDRHNPGRFLNFLNRPEDAHAHGRSPGGNVVSDILEDHSGHIWVSMYGGGLNRVDNDGRYRRYLFPADSGRTRENWVHQIHESPNGIFTLETDGGLLQFDPASGTFSRLIADELQGAEVFDMLDDAKGYMWLSTGTGLVRLDPKTRGFVIFDKSLGLPFQELISEFCVTSQGRVLAGGLDGFTEFYPDSVAPAASAPPIVLTGFSVFEKAMPAADFASREIRLTHDQNFFSFSFAALDYLDPQRNSYAYRMIGLDTGWVNAGHRNYAIYTNIDPGDYVFQVKGSNGEKVWDESGLTIRITLSPPYWQTWWFRSLVAVLLIAATYATYRFRLRHLLELERLRLRIANDLHDDVGSNLSAIAIVSRSAQRSSRLSPEIRRKIAEIYNTAVLTSDSMKDLVWFIKPENDTLDDLFVRMKETASLLLGDTEFTFYAPKDGTSKVIPIDFKRNVFLAFKEIITNVAKHAGATRVEIRVALRDDIVELVVSDNGKGFVESGIQRGNGLPSLRKRARSLGGSCEIDSGPGRGTTVMFSGRL